MDRGLVDQVRRFNRVVTERLGALNDAHLAKTRPLGQARLLWEIEPDGSDVRLLRSRSDLDSGYLSRLLRSLEHDGLVTVVPSESDGRVRIARLTAKGLGERRELEARSDELATGILEPLSEAQRARMIEAMRDVERLLVASAVELTVRHPGHPDARLCLRAYLSELVRRLDGGYDPDRALPVTDDEMSHPAGVFVVGTLYSEPVCCGGVKFHGADPAEIKRMWVGPSVRGLGLGRRLLEHLESRARAKEVKCLRLDTNGTLREAMSLYRSSGYVEIPRFNEEPHAQHWFEKAL